METDNQYKTVRHLMDDNKPVINKTIVIGIGNAGIRSLFCTQSLLEKRMHPEARRYVRWIAVNTDDVESTPGTGRYRFPSDQFLHEERNVLYLSVPGTSAMSKEFLNEKYKGDQYFDWLPDPEVYNIIDADNPSRVLARFNFFLSEDNIRRALIKERDRLDQLSDEPRYFRLAGPGSGATKKKSRISVFIIASPLCSTGSGMFLDITAMVRDIFRTSWPGPDIYGVLTLSPDSEQDESAAIPDTYAFMKELDYFMSGGRFISIYPSGRKVEIQDSLFDNGNVYFLGDENMAGRILDKRGYIYDLSAELVSAFISRSSGGAVDVSAVYESFRIPLYQSVKRNSMRKACYSSFGISRAVYPLPELIEAGYRAVAVKIIESFFSPVNAGLLSETLGTMAGGLVQGLKLDCRMIFESMHPVHKSDIENETVYVMNRFVPAGSERDKDTIIAVMKDLITSYDLSVLARRMYLMISVMERRYRPRLERISTIIAAEFEKYISDPERGLLFAEMTADILRERLDLYIKKYRSERITLARYSSADMEELMKKQAEMEIRDDGIIESFIHMVSFNYSQCVYESMLVSAEAFALEFRGTVAGFKGSIIVSLHKKAATLKRMLQREITGIKSGLLEETNPFMRILVNEAQIDSFIEKYFFSRISVRDLCADTDLLSFSGREEDPESVMESFLISRRGVEVFNMDRNEAADVITGDYGDISDKDTEELIAILYSDDTGMAGSSPDENAFYKSEIDNIKKKLFRVIHTRSDLSGLNSFTVRDMLDERQMTMNGLFEQLDISSRPFINADNTLSGPVEYYRAVAGFGLDAGDNENEGIRGTAGDLPPRLQSPERRKNSEPPVYAEVYEAPALCGNYEVASIGALTGFPLAGIMSVREWAGIYHTIVSGRKRPLHIFNSSSLNAKYFPDPAGGLNYPDPVRLWSGLLLLNILEEKNGLYSYTESLVPVLKDLEARENYRKVILELYSKIEQHRDAYEIPPELLAEVVSGLGILAKNPSDGRLHFRRDYLPVIADIIAGENPQQAGTDQRGDAPIPGFGSSMELAAFIENNSKIKIFITGMVRSVIERSLGNITAGADITLPARRIEQTVLPVFKNKFEFYDYYESRGSLEWQNILMKALAEKLDEYLSSSRFRINDGKGSHDRSKISELLKALEQRIPEAVLMEAEFRNRA